MSTRSPTAAVANNISSTSTNGQNTQPKQQHQRSLNNNNNNNNNTTTNKSTSFCTNSNSPNSHRHLLTSKEANLDQTSLEGEHTAAPAKSTPFSTRSNNERVSNSDFNSDFHGESSNANVIGPDISTAEIAPYCKSSKSNNIFATSSAGVVVGGGVLSCSSESDSAAVTSELTSLTNYNAPRRANQYQQQQQSQNHNHTTAPPFYPQTRNNNTISSQNTNTSITNSCSNSTGGGNTTSQSNSTTNTSPLVVSKGLGSSSYSDKIGVSVKIKGYQNSQDKTAAAAALVEETSTSNSWTKITTEQVQNYNLHHQTEKVCSAITGSDPHPIAGPNEINPDCPSVVGEAVMTSAAMPTSLSRSSSNSSTSFNTPSAISNSTTSVANNGIGGSNNLANSNSTSSTFNSNNLSYPLNASNTSHNFHNANYNSTVAHLDHNNTLGTNLNTNSSNSVLSPMQTHTNQNQLSSMATLTGHHNSKDSRPNSVSSPSTNKHRLRGFTDSVTSGGMSHSSISAVGDGLHNVGSPRTPNLKHDMSTYQASVDSQFPYVGAQSPSMGAGSEFLQKSISDTKLDSNAEKEMSSDGLTGSSTPFSKSFSSSKPSKKESLREQKKFYRQEKKKFAQEIMSTLNDPSIEMIANFLKVRTNLKTWIRLYCVLKPGLLVLYRSQKTNKSGQWVATVLLSACQLMERPSKKDGFCFKLFHPLEQSIWALRGPHGESTSLMGLNLPSCYLIFRALSDSDGKCWMDHLELTMKIAPARLKSSMNENAQNESILTSPVDEDHDYEFDHDTDDKIHFRGDVLFDNETEEVLESENDDAGNRQHLDSSSTVDPDPNEPSTAPNSPGIEMGPLGKPVETKYVLAPPEVMGDLEGGGQEESVHGENKSLILTLVKQVKPGMDLSKVVLPTFILEPRSFLDKLSDYYYHCDMISSAIAQEDPFERMKSIVIFYLAGFYKKPKGLKKPYNPILGEYFRCYWQHPSGSKTFYIAEQVSHHPPISTFHVSNRAEGFAISGTILAKSRFYGTSVSALFDGTAKLTLLTKGEDYDITFPYAFCKGILFGTLSMELGGKVHVNCEKTGYHTDIEFKLKPYLFGGKDSTNSIMGYISLGGKKLASIEGKWDGEIFMTDFRGSSPERSLIWAVTPEVKSKRLPRHVVDFAEQDEFESEKLWSKVEKAINTGNQNLATEEKFVLEDRQRKEAKARTATGQTWETKFFREDPMGSGQYIYKFSDYRPWDKENDMRQYENRGVIRTLTKHKIAPLVRSSGAHNGGNSRRPSLGTGLQSSLDTPVEADEEETSGDERWPDSVSETPVGCDQVPVKKTSITVPPSAPQPRVQSRASGSAGRSPVGSPAHESASSVAIARKLSEVLDENTKAINMLRQELVRLRNERNRAFNIMTFIITVAIAVLVQIFFQYFSHLFHHS